MNQTPTDAELMALVETHLGLKTHRDNTVFDPRTGRSHEAQRYRDFARAVLAKWGQPAQAAEPVAYSTGNTLKWHEGKGLTNAQLFAAPQPVAREPLPKFLTLKFHARRYKKATVTLLFPGHEAADAWVRGIKGGQHDR